MKQGLVDEQSIQDQSRVIEFKKNIEIEIENKSASRRNGVAPVHSYLYLLKKNPGVKSGRKTKTSRRKRSLEFPKIF